MIELHFACICGAGLSVAYDPASREAEVQALRAILRRRGWVTGQDLVDKDGRVQFFAYCSIGCQNERARNQRLIDEAWWRRRVDAPASSPPVCTCRLERQPDGRLFRVPALDCPWHTWMHLRRLRRNADEYALYERWKDVPIGTAVRERDGVCSGRGCGVTTSTARLVESSFGGHLTALVAWDQLGCHPRLGDLEIDDGEQS